MGETGFIEVTGVGAAEVPSDRMRLHVGVRATEDSVAAAFTAADAALARMLAALRRSGVEQLQTTEVDVHSDHDPGPRQGLPGGAEQYAELAGRRLGAVMSVREPGGDPRSVPEAHPLSASASIEGGTRSVRATVTVRWATTDAR